MLIPSVISAGDIAQGFALVVEPVILKSHPRDKYVYAHDSAQYDYKADDWKPNCKTGAELVRIHKQGFDRLAQAAKIDWLPAQIVRDPNFPDRMMASVEGMIRTSTGELYRVQDIAGMDMEIEREKLMAQHYEKETGGVPKQKMWLVERDLLRKKEHQPKLCISAAKNRVIKQLLCLRNTYTVNELKLEFVAVRIVPHLDMNDPYTRKRVTDVQIAAMAGIYGLLPNATPAPQGQIEMSGTVPDTALRGEDDVIDAETTNGGDKTYKLESHKPPPPADEEPPFTSSPESLRADFTACDTDGQCKCLRVMAGERKFDLEAHLKKAKVPKALEQHTPKYRLELYDFFAGWGKEKAA